MNTIIAVTDISKAYGGVKALNSVSFDLLKGEVHALVGQNGAGKSTLIRILSGATQADEGRIFYDGQEAHISSPRAAFNMGIATVYQEPSIYPDLNVVENIYMGRELKDRFGNILWDEQRQQAISIFQTLNIDPHFLDSRMGDLGMGIQQLVLIAKALSHEAKMMIFDEPTSILSEKETETLFDIIRRLKKREVGIIYISHRLEEVFEIADRVTIMRDGEVKGTFQTQELTRDNIIEMMAGKALMSPTDRKSTRTDEQVLEVRNLSSPSRYHDVSFALHKGEILGIFGLVGSGRTDVAQAVFGANPPESGQIFVHGTAVTLHHPSQALKHGIAYLPKDRKVEGLFGIMTIMENLSISIIQLLSRFGFFVDFRREIAFASQTVQETSIKIPGLKSKVTALSGGNQQKVVLARWLAQNPKILILDEPTRGIDVASKEEIHNRIFALASQGISIIIISSELPEVMKLSDRVLVMHEGKISGTFAQGEADSTTILKAAIG
ncbi:ABC transporter related protein [Candidatus Vecturithrix granuli]|uniref:ABC transporter related protein n=1 Tax=Vecturithrix granuli TaxID=1499967 RepID=A0A081C3X3_VECG1|nr:ABC transporter related protein [Candidatus Vecturithrix granuli]